VDTKLILDKHFTDNYNYYRNVCWKYYRGRYLFEDLFHESYLLCLREREETVIRLFNVDKLHYLVLRRIGYLFRHRKSATNRKSQVHDGANLSSPLFETPNVSYEVDFPSEDNDLVLDLTEQEVRDYFEKATAIMEKALQQPVIVTKAKTDFQKVQTVIAVLQSNVNQIHKLTGISRPFITETYNQGKQFIKEQILK
jgi:hypothetical protein